MRVFLALLRRELGTSFKSLTGYVVIAAVLLLNGFSLVDMITKFNGKGLDAPVTEVFYQTAYFWVILLLSAPVITMRAFAAEKASGTYETLMTTPVGDWQVVLAKFAGTLVFFVFTWLPLLAVLFVLRQITGESALFEPRVVAVTLAGIGLVGALYMAMGCFASALTRSQIIAAMVSFLLGIGLWVLSLRTLLPDPAAGWAERLLATASIVRHMEDFARGVVDARHVVFLVSLTWLFLFLTHRVVQSRRWK
jgi:ABC-2 type transport system permease protein